MRALTTAMRAPCPRARRKRFGQISVSAMTISYDIFNSTTNLYQAAIDGSLVPNAAFIRKINISLTLQSNGTGAARNEIYTISTAISPRDLSFQDRY